MTLRTGSPMTNGKIVVDLICDVSCDGAHSSGSYSFWGRKQPVALIIDDGIRKTIWKLHESLTTEELVQHLEGDHS